LLGLTFAANHGWIDARFPRRWLRPLSGLLADRFNAATVASMGLLMIVVGIACYSRLGTDSDYCLVMAALICVGAGIGMLTPANQRLLSPRSNKRITACLRPCSTRRICRRATICVCLPAADWIVALIVADKSRREKQSAT